MASYGYSSYSMPEAMGYYPSFFDSTAALQPAMAQPSSYLSPEYSSGTSYFSTYPAVASSSSSSPFASSSSAYSSPTFSTSSSSPPAELSSYTSHSHSHSSMPYGYHMPPPTTAMPTLTSSYPAQPQTASPSLIFGHKEPVIDSPWNYEPLSAVPTPPLAITPSPQPVLPPRRSGGIKKRTRTPHACEPCRKRKAKCSGETRCTRCTGKNLQCVYAGDMRRPARSHVGMSQPAELSPPAPVPTFQPIPGSNVLDVQLGQGYSGYDAYSWQ